MTTAAVPNYDCSDNYDGSCYDCFYNEAMCHRALPQTIYKNGVIYTVDTSNNWIEYEKSQISTCFKSREKIERFIYSILLK